MCLLIMNCFNLQVPKKNPQQLISNIIFSEILMDNNIYYSHNLKLLDQYRGKNINNVKKELFDKFNNIQFIFIHKSQLRTILDINIIYVLYDDLYRIIDFKGIDYKKN